MSLKLKVWLGAILVLVSGCTTEQNPWSSGRWVDLTHSFSPATIYWPTAEPFHLDEEFSGVTPKGFHYAANRFRASEHGGTHMDAPIHFAADGLSVDQIPVDQLIGPAAVIDVSSRALMDRDYQVTIADLSAWESAHGVIPEHSIVLIRTGYDRFWPDPLKYLGTADRGEAAVAKLHFPGLAPAAAEWLAEQRRIRAVGLDTASIDYGQSVLFESHRILARRTIPIFENVTRLDELPPIGALAVALPMKIQGGSGAPLRLVAWAPQE
ncbi:MAG: cyclase family protein [Pseudomonadota bacterium]|jgi:kynurenine formamidase